MLVFNTTELDEVMSQRYMDKLQLRDCNGLPILTRLGLGEVASSIVLDPKRYLRCLRVGRTYYTGAKCNGTAMHQIPQPRMNPFARAKVTEGSSRNSSK